MENKFVLHPEETTLDFPLNLPNESFYQMRREFRFFGIRGSHCLKINLEKRLYNFIKENGDEKFFELCINEIKKYSSVMKNKLTRLMELISELEANPPDSKTGIEFNSLEDFNECFNSIFRKAFLIPDEFDSILLVEPMDKTLKKFFRKRGYLFEIRGESLYEQIDYYDVVIAKLIESREVTETLFGVKIKYNFQKISSFYDLQIQGFPSFYNITKNLIRVDELSGSLLTVPERMLNHPEVQQFFKNNLNFFDNYKESILLHEKMHVLFYKVLRETYKVQDTTILNPQLMAASEIFSRLVTQFISFTPLSLEYYHAHQLGNSNSAVYLASYNFFNSYTDLLNRSSFSSIEEFIFHTRTKAFDGILTWVNYMKNNFNHEPQIGWLKIAGKLEKEYNKMRASSTGLKAKYYPDLDGDED